MPAMASAVRIGRARSPRQAMVARRIGLLEPELGEAADQRLGVVILAASEGDLVAHLSITDDDHAVGVGSGAGIVRDQDDGLVQAIGRVPQQVQDLDRKSTRLNSSHGYISY